VRVVPERVRVGDGVRDAVALQDAELEWKRDARGVLAARLREVVRADGLGVGDGDVDGGRVGLVEDVVRGLGVGDCESVPLHLGVVRGLLRQSGCNLKVWLLLRVAVVVGVVLRDAVGVVVRQSDVEPVAHCVVLGVRVSISVGVGGVNTIANVDGHGRSVRVFRVDDAQLERVARDVVVTESVQQLHAVRVRVADGVADDDPHRVAVRLRECKWDRLCVGDDDGLRHVDAE
jgi:hypothetical protein